LGDGRDASGGFQLDPFEAFDAEKLRCGVSLRQNYFCVVSEHDEGQRRTRIAPVPATTWIVIGRKDGPSIRQ